MEKNNQQTNPEFSQKHSKEIQQSLKKNKLTKKNKWLVPALTIALILSLGMNSIFAYQNLMIIQKKANKARLEAENKKEKLEKMLKK